MFSNFLSSAGQSHPPGKKNLSPLKGKSENLKVPHGGEGRVPTRGASGRDPSRVGGPTVRARDPALRPARGVPVHPTPGAGGGPSPPTEANDPRVAQLAGEKGPGRETVDGARGRAPLTAGAGQGHGVGGGGRCSAAAPLTGETGGSASRVTLLSSFYASSGAPGPAHGAAQARLLHGSLNWVKKNVYFYLCM